MTHAQNIGHTLRTHLCSYYSAIDSQEVPTWLQQVRHGRYHGEIKQIKSIGEGSVTPNQTLLEKLLFMCQVRMVRSM